jgi:hypothetical protein
MSSVDVDQFFNSNCSLSENEDDPRDKFMPSITYLQKLGPEHLQQIFESSRWIFEQNRDIAFEVRSYYLFALAGVYPY